MKNYLLIISLALGCPNLLIGEQERWNRYSSYLDQNESWSLLEELVVVQPQRSVDAWFGGRGISVGASLGAACLTFFASKQAFSSSNKIGKVCSASAGMGVGLVTYYSLQTYLLDRSERKQIALIMKNWNHLRDRIPHQVWPMLDTLYHYWLNDKERYESMLDETLSYLKAEVHGKFSSRYKATSESFFTSRNLNVQVRVNLYKFAKSAFLLAKELFE
jgi:hypothetical protein